MFRSLCGGLVFLSSAKVGDLFEFFYLVSSDCPDGKS